MTKVKVSENRSNKELAWFWSFDAIYFKHTVWLLYKGLYRDIL